MKREICNENQKALYFDWKLNKDSDAYHLPFIFHISGQLDSARLINAIDYLLDTYNVFKLRFIEDRGNLYYESIESAPKTEHFTFCDPACNVDEIVEEYRYTFFHKEFDLNNGQNVYFALLDFTSHHESYLLVNCHHIIADVYSFYQFFSANLSEIYNTGKVPDFLKQDVIKDKYENLYKYTLKNEIEDNLYFNDKLSKVDDLSNIKNDYESNKNAIYDVAIINRNKKKIVTTYCTENKITPFVFYLGCYTILLHKILDKNKIVIGTPIANRPTKESKKIFGYFVNTLPLTIDISEEWNVSSLFSLLRDEIYKLVKHKNASLKSILINNDRLINSTQIFDNIFTYYLQGLTFDLLNCRVISIPIQRKNAQFPLSVIVEDTEGSCFVRFIREKGVFENINLKNLYLKIVDELLESSTRIIKDIKLVDKEEWKDIIRSTCLDISHINNHVEGLNEDIISYFNNIVNIYPDKVACQYGEEEITYKKLLNRARFYGKEISSKLYYEKNQKVILLLPIGLHQIVGIFSTLYANKIYVPIDPTIPIERINYIVNDTQASLIVTTNSVSEALNLDKEKVLIIDNIDIIDSELEYSPSITPNNVAYIIYTSGTTGAPKGVMVTHSNVIALLKSTKNLFSFQTTDNWSMLHSYSFDFSVWEIFGALLNGCTLTIASDNIRKSHELFWNFIQEKKITILNQTPSYFTQLAKYATEDKRNTHLKTVIFGGEKLNFKHLALWTNKYPLSRIQLINMYGITETTVHVTYYKLAQKDIDKKQSIIGKAIPSWGILILDSKGNPLPKGVIGEICVFGKGISKGYLNKEDLNKEKFQYIDLPTGEKCQIYKSGDLGVISNNYQIEYVGRKDRQIKIRGYRIETKEIETVMLEHKACCMSAVKVVNLGIDDDRLVGYYITNEENLDEKSLRSFISKKLPQYMVPFYLIRLDKFPLTINGKIDYNKLDSLIDIKNHNEDSIQQTDPLEKAITKAVYKVLRTDKVCGDDNFFDLGGNSLLMNGLVTGINTILRDRKIEKEIHVIDLYQYPTINKITDFITHK